MTVKDLIEELKKYPENLEVSYDVGWTSYPVSQIEDQYSRRDNKYIRIGVMIS